MTESKKSILVVSRSFYPEISPRAFRTTELIKEFARQGHSVTLLTVKNEEYHNAFEKKYGVEIKDFGPLSFPELGWSSSIKPLKIAGRAVNLGAKLLFEYPDIEIMYRVENYLLKMEKTFDLLVSVAVPHPIHWGVAKARKDDNAIAKIWVADCGDPYMGFEKDRFRKPFWFAHYEKLFCRKADYITVPIEGAKEAYYNEFRPKIRVIPQGFDFEGVKVGSSDYQENEVPTFGYAGGLWGGGRNPDELLQHLCSVDKPFKFVIYTKNRTPLKPYINHLNHKLAVHDYIPRGELLKRMAEMDFLVNLENDTSKQQPSKLIDYYLTGRPVLSVPSRGLNTDVVDAFMSGDYSRQYVFENMEQYRIENVTRKFLALCNQ